MNQVALSNVLDIATELTSLARLPFFRDRVRTWNMLARSANRRLGNQVPADVLDAVGREVWAPGPVRIEFVDEPTVAVRVLLARTLTEPAAAAEPLSAALETTLREFPAAVDLQRRDAALRAIAGQSIRLSADLQRTADLRRLLAKAAETSNDEVKVVTRWAQAALTEGSTGSVAAAGAGASLDLSGAREVLNDLTSGLDRDTRRRIEVHSADPHRAAFNPVALRPMFDLLASADLRSVPGVGAEPGARAAAPTGPDRFNVGVVDAAAPVTPVREQSLRPAHEYLVWASVGPADPDALADPTDGVDLSGLKTGARLDVVLFVDGPNAGPGRTSSGSLLLGSGRPLQVASPADDASVPAELRRTRLYFRVTTPEQSGDLHARLCLYHRNTLLQVRHLHFRVGPGTARLQVRTPYTITAAPTAPDVAQLAPRRLSVYTNSTREGSHDFIFRAVDGAREVALPGVFDGPQVQSFIDLIRGGLRIAAWGTDGKASTKTYKYTPDESGRFGTFDQLRDDLIGLARNGFRAWETITSGFQDRKAREDLQDLMRTPGGIVELAPRTDSTFVLPLAGLYDHDLDDQLTDVSFCGEAEEALRSHADLATMRCFGPEGCPDVDDSTVCPSGFWGFRHLIGVPIPATDGDGDGLPLVIGDGVQRTALVGTVPEGVVDGVTGHASAVVGRLPGSVHVTGRDPWFAQAQEPARYPILYFLCHGEKRAGGPVLVLDELGRPGISRSNLKVKKVALSHGPLVVLNACDTAALEPDQAIDLVRGFTYNGATAVIGTEITIFTSLAYRFGLAFLDALLDRPTAGVGAALHSSRLELLRHGNPLGLAYILYGLSDAHL